MAPTGCGIASRSPPLEPPSGSMTLHEPMTALIEVHDGHFAWLLGEAETPVGLCAASGGVGDRQVLVDLRRMVARLRQDSCRAHWLILSGQEVVGLCGLKRLPLDGVTDIGYGIAPSRRGRGHATRAVALMLRQIADTDAVSVIKASTSVSYCASQAVLERERLHFGGPGPRCRARRRAALEPVGRRD